MLLLVCYAASFYIYRYTIPPVSGLKRWILILLRGTALSLVVLAIVEPLLQWWVTIEQKPVVAVLADNSLSMTQNDGAGERKKILSELLNHEELKSLSASTDVRLFSFSHALLPLSQESLQFNGGSSNISNAIQSVIKTNESLQGIILLSDGNYNAGLNPLYDAERSRVPLFTVGIGDTVPQKDISVVKVLMNSIGYVNTAIPVEVTLTSSGISNPSTSVSLFEDGKKIDEKSISVYPSSSASVARVQFSYTPSTEGIKKITAAVSSTAGEITEKNNRRSGLVKILKSKLSIVVIAGAVSADVTTVMQMLNADENIGASVWYQLPDGALRSQRPNADVLSTLQRCDAVIFIGFPAAHTPVNLIEQIEQSVSSQALPLLFISSRTLDVRNTRRLEHLFPFTIAAERMDEQMVLPAVAPKQSGHQLLRSESVAWEKLPPLFYSLQTFLAKPEAQSLLNIKIQNVTLPNPLFLTRTAGNAKSAAILAYGIHRWKVMAGASDETKGIFSSWFSSLIRWLATREQDKFLRVETVKEYYSQGEPIDFTGQVYNENYLPVDDAEVRISLQSLHAGGRFETALSAIGSGIYEGALNGMPEGDYIYSATALRSGDTVGTTKGRISVGEQSMEFTETTMNKALMQQLASASGGKYSDAAAFRELIKTIAAREEMQILRRERKSEIELWNLPSLLAVVILLLGVEWLMRKQSGML